MKMIIKQLLSLSRTKKRTKHCSWRIAVILVMSFTLMIMVTDHRFSVSFRNLVGLRKMIMCSDHLHFYREKYSFQLKSLECLSGLELLNTNAMELEQMFSSVNGSMNIVAIRGHPISFSHDVKITNMSEPGESCWNKKRFENWRKRSIWARIHHRWRINLINKTLGETHIGQFKENTDTRLSSSYPNGDSPQSNVFLRHCPGTTIFDIYMIIISGYKNYRSRGDVIMCTWGEQIPYENLVFIGDGPDPLSQLPIHHVTNSSHPWDYWASQKKWLIGLLHAFDQDKLNGSRKWFALADDDTYYSVNNLLSLVNTYDHEKEYMIGELCDFKGFLRICGGGGWLISLGMARKIHKNLTSCFDYRSPKYGKIGWSDVFLPLCVSELLGVKFTGSDEFNIHSFEETNSLYFQLLKPFGYKKLVTFHVNKPWQRAVAHYRTEKAFTSYIDYFPFIEMLKEINENT